MSGNFIISWRVPHNRVDLRRQEMHTIISSLAILHSDQFFRPNLRRCMYGTISFVVVNATYSSKNFIRHYYHGVIVIWGISTIWVRIHKTEGPVKSIIAYLILIKLCDATWASYICNIRLHGHGYNVCISTIPTCIATLEICVALLF